MSRLCRRKDACGRPRGPWIGWGYDAAGRRFGPKSTRTTDREAAEKILRQWEREHADPAGARAATAQKVTLAQACTVTLAAYEASIAVGKHSAVMLGFYRGKVGHFRRLWGDGALLAVLDAPRVDGYIATRREEGASEATIKKELVCLSMTLKHARRAWPSLPDPATVLPVRFAGASVPRTRTLTREELALLLAELERRTPDHAARVAFIVATSARWGETERAERADVADDLVVVKLRGTKTDGAARTVPVLAAFRPLLAYALKHATGKAPMLFMVGEAFKHRLAAVSTRTLASPCSANDLRRTCATWLHEAGAPARLIAPVLGHTTDALIQTTYGKLSADALGRLLQSAVDRNTGATATADSAGDERTGQHTESPSKQG